MPAFVGASSSSSSVLARRSSSAAAAASPKAAQKGQLTRGRRGERGERQEEKREQWERDAAPRRQDLSGGGGGDCDVNEPHCPRMETSNGKPKPLSLSLSLPFLAPSLPPKSSSSTLFSLTLFSSSFLPSFLMPLSHCCCFSQHAHTLPALAASWSVRNRFQGKNFSCFHVTLFKHDFRKKGVSEKLN